MLPGNPAGRMRVPEEAPSQLRSPNQEDQKKTGKGLVHVSREMPRGSRGVPGRALGAWTSSEERACF